MRKRRIFAKEDDRVEFGESCGGERGEDELWRTPSALRRGFKERQAHLLAGLFGNSELEERTDGAEGGDGDLDVGDGSASEGTAGVATHLAGAPLNRELVLRFPDSIEEDQGTDL